ncbi:Vesicle-associated membrane protein 3 [Chelonia mydas]|uniref:Vesicle-associated membrane protein 3 n=1 Tax=Chelonia mydas TaxID=8469 RepID=M7C492_CHEMY|nr:Vesicle-associated membrane protein 3 [Chelonia mydas]
MAARAAGVSCMKLLPVGMCYLRSTRTGSRKYYAVVDIMRVNVDKVLERDQKLSELDDRADALQAGASQFETSAAKLKRKYWWKNCKMWAILIAVVLIIIIIIIGTPDRPYRGDQEHLGHDDDGYQSYCTVCCHKAMGCCCCVVMQYHICKHPADVW